jgi:hypothetical protein
MKFDSASMARKSAADSLMRRVEAMTSQALKPRVVPMQDELDKGARGEVESRHAITNQFEILVLAAASPALKRIGINGAHFVEAKQTANKDLISGRKVRELVELGLLDWVNESRSAVVITDKGRHDAWMNRG